jgi:hypothetical protein
MTENTSLYYDFQKSCPSCDRWVTVHPIDRRPEHGCPMEVWDREGPPLLHFPRPASRSEGDA